MLSLSNCFHSSFHATNKRASRANNTRNNNDTGVTMWPRQFRTRLLYFNDSQRTGGSCLWLQTIFLSLPNHNGTTPGYKRQQRKRLTSLILFFILN